MRLVTLQKVAKVGTVWEKFSFSGSPSLQHSQGIMGSFFSFCYTNPQLYTKLCTMEYWREFLCKYRLSSAIIVHHWYNASSRKEYINFIVILSFTFTRISFDDKCFSLRCGNWVKFVKRQSVVSCLWRIFFFFRLWKKVKLISW